MLRKVIKMEGEISEAEKVIEAALFMASRPLSMKELLHVASGSGAFSLTDIKSALTALQKNYGGRGSFIEVVEAEGSWLMRVKPGSAAGVEGLAQETELSKRALRVLAIVAQHEGVMQSRVVKIVGSSTYEGVAELVEKGYLTFTKKGNSKILRPSKKFRTYFGDVKKIKEEIKQEEKQGEVGG
jgi:segregation and condensation protein B